MGKIYIKINFSINLPLRERQGKKTTHHRRQIDVLRYNLIMEGNPYCNSDQFLCTLLLPFHYKNLYKAYTYIKLI